MQTDLTDFARTIQTRKPGILMRYASLDAFLTTGKSSLTGGPVAMIFVEDDVEIESTLSHHIALGFQSVLVFLPDTFPLSADLADKVQRINFDATLPDQVFGAINQVIDAAPVGTWLYYCYNAEYLFFPFCETRSVRELLTFHSEERRDAMMTYVVDLYARDLAKNPDAVSRSESCLDRHGYYALTRWDNESKRPLDRQMDFFGGLRWRFEEHVPWQSRRIDRISLFRSRKNLTLLANHTFDEAEYNTVSCRGITISPRRCVPSGSQKPCGETPDRPLPSTVSNGRTRRSLSGNHVN